MKKVIPPGVYVLDFLCSNRLFKLLGGKNLQQFCLHRIFLKHVTVNVLFAMQLRRTVFVVFVLDECFVQFSVFKISFTNHITPFSLKLLFQPCFFNTRFY